MTRFKILMYVWTAFVVLWQGLKLPLKTSLWQTKLVTQRTRLVPALCICCSADALHPVYHVMSLRCWLAQELGDPAHLAIQKPSNGAPFIISNKPFRDIVRSYKIDSSTFHAAGWTFAGIGVLILTTKAALFGWSKWRARKIRQATAKLPTVICASHMLFLLLFLHFVFWAGSKTQMGARSIGLPQVDSEANVIKIHSFIDTKRI